jgi:ankyrin repeat protein
MSSLNELEFQPVITWYDAAEFAGRVVAYQTDSDCFGADKGYNQRKTHFGYIGKMAFSWKDLETGFNMQRLLKPGDVEGVCGLIESLLKSRKSPLSMRGATEEEIEFIGEAISADQAKFERMSGKKEMFEILERSLHPKSSLSSRPFGIPCASCKKFLAAPVIRIPECRHFLHETCYASASEKECPGCQQKFTEGMRCPELEELISKIDSLNRIICKVDELPSQARLFTLALEKGELSVAAYVVSSSPNLVNELVDGISPLYRVCGCGQSESVRFLLDHGANPNIQNDLSPKDQEDEWYWKIRDHNPLHGATPIRAAAQSGSRQIGKLLIAAKAPLDERGPFGRTPLFEAVLAGHEALARLFIKRGANTSTKDDFGNSLFVPAACNGLFKVVQKLFNDSVFINEAEMEMALHRVAGSDYTALLHLLLDHGAKEVINKVWLGKGTPIARAIGRRKLENVKILVQAGADLSIRYKGLSLLEYAKKKLEDLTCFYNSHPDPMETKRSEIIKERQDIVNSLTSEVAKSTPQ